MATTSPLRQWMIEDIRNLSWATQLSYIYAVAKFSRHFNPSPEGLDDCMHEMAPFKLRKGGTMRWA
jgi:integrase/recombinase XerD